MTVLLVLLFFGSFILIDYIREWNRHRKTSDVYCFDDAVGFSMADGGEKIEKKDESKK